MNRAISKTLILIFTFLSCAKSFNKDSILGTWYSVEIKEGDESTPKTDLEFTIKENSMLVEHGNDKIQKVTHSLSAIDPERKVILLDVNNGRETIPMIFTLSNDTLFMEESSSGEKTIITLLKKLK